MGNVLGRTVKIDYNTQNSQRGKFSRVAVDIELDKPVKGQMKIDGEIQRVECEDLPNICYSCGRVGHSSFFCPFKSNESVSMEQTDKNTTLHQTERETAMAEPAMAGEFGPWLHAPSHGRRNISNKERAGNQRSMICLRISRKRFQTGRK